MQGAAQLQEQQLMMLTQMHLAAMAVHAVANTAGQCVKSLRMLSQWVCSAELGGASTQQLELNSPQHKLSPCCTRSAQRCHSNMGLKE
jgi:hypothetical protein